jgi:hypothetical protein
MIDKRFYEHKATDPLRSILAVAIISLLLAVFGAWCGAIATANEMGCPTWLGSDFTVGRYCVPGPLNGLIWNAQYRAFPSHRVRANLASWPPAKRRHFMRALNASLIGAGVGFGVAVIVTIISAAAIRAKASGKRVMIEGTRFWANDDEVFATGLAVNYEPPLFKRLTSGWRKA